MSARSNKDGDDDMPALTLSTLLLRAPTARPLSPSLVEETLPGTDVTFEKGFGMFKRGIVFSATSGQPVKTSLPMPRMKAALTDVVQNLKSVGRQSASGSYNAFYSLNTAAVRSVAVATSASGTLDADDVPPNMGLRITKRPLATPVKADDMLLLWEEMWTTLIAAAAGLHPNVHLAGIVTEEWGQKLRNRFTGEERLVKFVGVRMAYVVDRFVSLRQMLYDNRYETNWGSSHRLDLSNLVSEISKAGFIHTDIKPANIVYDATRPSGSRFMMIDLGGDYTRLVRNNEVGIDCIQVINTLLMIITTFCSGNASNTAVVITSNLRASLLLLYLRIMRQDDKQENLLCRILSKLDKADAQRINEPSSFFRETDYTALAKQVLAMAIWYARVDTDRDVCAAGEDWREIFNKDTTLSAYQMFIKTINERVRPIVA